MAKTLPKIVLLGRPNVGKSTLFNRLIKSNRAITHDRPGITRDRMEGTVRAGGGARFIIVDTGGVTLGADDAACEGPEGLRGFEREILAQAEAALADAAAVALVVDGRDGLLPIDEYLASRARRSGLPLLCIVNKVDGEEHEARLSAEFHKLGMPLIAVSAAHGLHIPALLDRLRAILPEPAAADPPGEGGEDGDIPVVTEKARPLRLAFLGRPNAGKSSLLNALVGEGRMIVSDIAGTTRDSVDVAASVSGREYVFVDTAGVRRRTRITDSVEKYSVNSSIKSTTKADITLLVLNCEEGLGVQDKRLIDLLNTHKTPFLILLNKRDLLAQHELAALRKDLEASLAFCGNVPVLPVSAKTGAGLKKILPMAERIREECRMRVPTGRLNRAMTEVLSRHEPPMVKGARPRFFYMTQAESEPPTFVFFVSDATRVSESYMRYLERGLRKLFEIRYAPMRLHLRSSHKKK